MNRLAAFAVALCGAAVAAVAAAGTSDCRFARGITCAEIMAADGRAAHGFALAAAAAEGAFHAPGVGYNGATGFTYDGHGIDYTTGDLAPGTLHEFSAPSKVCPPSPPPPPPPPPSTHTRAHVRIPALRSLYL